MAQETNPDRDPEVSVRPATRLIQAIGLAVALVISTVAVLTLLKILSNAFL